MTFRPQTALELTQRWHDQTLDLESLKFDAANQECVFTVTEQKQDASASVKSLLQKKPLQRCRVIIKNVTSMQALDAEGEVELYINEVESNPTSLRVKCVNGTLEIFGEALEASFDVEPSDAGETEVKLATPLGDVSWRRKQTKPQS